MFAVMRTTPVLSSWIAGKHQVMRKAGGNVRPAFGSQQRAQPREPERHCPTHVHRPGALALGRLLAVGPRRIVRYAECVTGCHVTIIAFDISLGTTEYY